MATSAATNEQSVPAHAFKHKQPRSTRRSAPRCSMFDWLRQGNDDGAESAHHEVSTEVPTPPVAGGALPPHPAGRRGHLRVGCHLRTSRTRVHRARACLAGRAPRRGRARPRALGWPASARACLLCRRAATTTFPLRPLLDSRMPTSARSNLGRSGQLSPASVLALMREGGPAARSCGRGAPRRASLTSRSSPGSAPPQSHRRANPSDAVSLSGPDSAKRGMGPAGINVIWERPTR
jgi:hypothetical protein